MYNIEDEVLKFRNRAQFGIMSYLYIVLFIFSILFTIGYIQDSSPWFLLSLFMACLFMSLMFNIRGVDIDLNSKIIITYKKVLGYRIKRRYNLDDFQKISITQKRVSVRTSRGSDHRSDSYYYYYLNLVCPDRNRTLILAESQNYREIVAASEALSFQIGVGVWDEV